MPFAAIGEERGRSEASIYGHVIDKGTGEHVPYVMVSLKGTVIGTATAGSGHYYLEHLPEESSSCRFQEWGIRLLKKRLN